MDLSSIEQIIRTQVPNAPDSDVELYLDSVQRDMKFGGDYSDMSEDDIVEDFEFYIQSRMDEAQKPSMKMKKSELKEMIKAAFLSEADFTNAQDDDAAPAIAADYDPLAEGEDEEESLDDILARVMGTKADPYMAEDLNEAEEEEEEEVDIDVKDTDLSSDDEEVESANDSIVVDKKIVSLSSLPQETRKILDTLETLRAQAEEFGDQKFITQVGNTITFFTRDFVVAGDQPNPAGIEESLEILKMKKLAGLLTEGEYAKALLKEAGGEMQFLPSDPIPGTVELTSDIFNSIKNKLMSSGKEILNKIPKDQLIAMKSAAEKVLGPGFGKEDLTIDNAEKVGKVLMSKLNEANMADTIGGILALVGMGTGITAAALLSAPVAIGGLVAMILGYIIKQTFGDDNDISIDRGI
jgi:hypothetical protein